MALSNTNAKTPVRSPAPVDRRGRGRGSFPPAASSVANVDSNIDRMEYWRRPLLHADLHLDVATERATDLFGIHGRGRGRAGYSGHRHCGGVLEPGGDRGVTLNDQAD